MVIKKDILPREFMGYVEMFGNRIEKIRDEETREKINSLYIHLSSLKLTNSLIIQKIEPVRTEIIDSIKQDDFKNMVDPAFDGLSIKINNYLSYISDNLTHAQLCENILSEFIIELVEKIDDLKSKLEESSFKEESTEPIKTKEEVEIPDIEEDEEEEDFKRYLYRCINCNLESDKSNQGGCNKCGGEIFQVNYLN